MLRVFPFKIVFFIFHSCIHRKYKHKKHKPTSRINGLLPSIVAYTSLCMCYLICGHQLQQTINFCNFDSLFLAQYRCECIGMFNLMSLILEFYIIIIERGIIIYIYIYCTLLICNFIMSST